jgi:hypothetical protein
VTTEILKRAENVIFSKSNVIRLNQDKERSKDSPPLTSVIKKVENEKKSESFHVIVPVDSGTRSVEIKTKSNKNEPVKASIKERLGKKVTERSRSRSRSRKRYDGDINKSRRPDSSRKHISSCISTVMSMSKTESRNRDKVLPRRSRSFDRRDNRTKRYPRSRSKEEEARSHHKPGPSSSADHRTIIRKDHKKRRSDSPRSPEGNERKKLRSSSVESKKHKKKKKKEKKAKKKSHDRK